ncbi:uncharacterized protein LOC113363189 isoform X4 [Ctenocephalides felis]|uniref:uncharacterized protein LOC113363189 isoform X4 n=1 Tax=Ctenocephalides felis TaxID=7515 RepID=UPI000E6E21FB|nr:uncharacterized protein LOC113363189 isoform X4 [Ctenocephalides felis]
MDETEEYKKCYKLQQTLVELGNLIWDNSWSWTVIKQDVDFSVEKDGLFEVGVSTFVNITVLSNRLERQNVGYCYLSHMDRGTAYSLVRKMSVLNALKETMCSFGGVISDKVLMALQTNNCTIGLPSDHSTKTETRESRNENRNPQTKPCEPTKPKSPGKINRFPSKTFNDNPSAQNNISGNFSSSKPINQVNLPGIDRSNPNVRLPNSNNVQFVSKTPVNTKPSLVVHPKVPLQQMPSNVIAPITNDNTISYNNCHIQQDSQMFNNQVLSYQSPHKNNFVNNEWITPTIFHDGFWTENKVKLWANQNDLIHLTPTGDGSKC